MKIPIPKFYDRAMDWCAFHFLPPDKPTGLRLFGYKLTWLDLRGTQVTETGIKQLKQVLPSLTIYR